MNIVMFAILLSFTKHSSFFYFPRTFSPLLAVYLSLFSYIAPSHSRLFLLCIFQSLLWAWLYFLLLSFWNVLRAVCSSLPFLACFIFVWHRHSHTQKVCSNQMGGMRFLKKMFSYKRISFLVFFLQGIQVALNSVDAAIELFKMTSLKKRFQLTVFIRKWRKNKIEKDLFHSWNRQKWMKIQFTVFLFFYALLFISMRM